MSRVLVVGDVMKDVYLRAEGSRRAPEGNFPVWKITGMVQLPGGAGNVVENLQALGDTARLVHEWDESKDMPLKTRIVVDGVMVGRIDTNDHCPRITPEELGTAIAGFDPEAIIVSGYAKGALGLDLLPVFREVSVPVFVDTKLNPLPWVEIASGAFPNAAEYAEYSEVYDNFPMTMVKLGARGVVRLTFGKVMQQVAGHPVSDPSVVGAGDSVIAAWVSEYLMSHDPDWATVFANAAGAVSVSMPGTTAPLREEILEIVAGRRND